MKPGTEITPKLLTKLEGELIKLLREKADIEAQIGPLWADLRMARLAGHRGGLEIGPLPQLSGIDSLERSSQENAERVERSNYQLDHSPEHLAELRRLNDLSAA
jgi:hypothetical protein